MLHTYREWGITWCSYQQAYEALSPNYEPVWRGEADGWDDGERFAANTLDEVYAEIDARIAEEAEYQADCAGDAEHERRRHEED